MPGTPKPTEEQAAALAEFDTGRDFVVEALAGTGKTTMLRMLSNAAPKHHGLYVAYNKTTADDASRTFPRNVETRTLHSLAYRPMYQERPTLMDRLNANGIPPWEAQSFLGAHGMVLGGKSVPAARVVALARDTVSRFCYSADPELTADHLPPAMVPGMTFKQVRRMMERHVLPVAKRYWDDVTRDSGRLRFNHDVYLKLWTLNSPVLGYDFLMLDEAQDSNPLTSSWALAQSVNGTQTVAVGDNFQSLYEWRGATSEMNKYNGKRLPLTKSWRFGPAIADQANLWLEYLQSDLRITGNDAIQSDVNQMNGLPDAVLCRTNAETVAVLMDLQERNVPARIEGGAKEIAALADAALELQTRGSTKHRDLEFFDSWNEVTDFVETDDGEELRTFVRLVNKHTAPKVRRALEMQSGEDEARVVLSTAHRAKGREWNRVQIGADFEEPKEGNTATRADSMLAYVSVTRAQRQLDVGPLGWVEKALGRGERAGQRLPDVPTNTESVTEVIVAGAVPTTDHDSIRRMLASLTPTEANKPLCRELADRLVGCSCSVAVDVYEPWVRVLLKQFCDDALITATEAVSKVRDVLGGTLGSYVDMLTKPGMLNGPVRSAACQPVEALYNGLAQAVITLAREDLAAAEKAFSGRS